MKIYLLLPLILFVFFESRAFGLTDFQCVENKPLDRKLERVIVKLTQNNSGRYDFERSDVPVGGPEDALVVIYYNMDCDLDILQHSSGNLDVAGGCEWSIVPEALEFAPGNDFESVAIIGLDSEGRQIAYGKTFKCVALANSSNKNTRQLRVRP